MNHKLLLQAALRLFFTLAAPLLLTAVSVRLIMTYEFLRFEYPRPDFPADGYGFSAQDRLAYAPYGIDYLLNGEDIDFLGDLRLPRGKCWQPLPGAEDCPMYQPRALAHLADVKRIIQTVFWLAFLFGLTAVGLAGLTHRSAGFRRAIRIGLTYGSRLTLAAVAATAMFAVTAWDFFFDRFHELFFASGTWRFAFSDTLIRLFPERFWFDAAIAIGILDAVAALLILILMRRWGKARPASAGRKSM